MQCVVSSGCKEVESMLDLIMFPFKLVWEIISFVFDLVGGVIGLVFGLAGGIIGLMVRLCLLSAFITAICAVVRHIRQKPAEPENEEFISYYDKDAVK